MPDNAPAPSSGNSAPSSAPSSTPAAATSPSSGSPTSGAPSASPSATPASPGQASGSPSGEPPRERWNDILENARKKTRGEVEAEYREKYGRLEQDPWGAVQEWLDAASKHSHYGPLVSKWAQGRTKPERGEEPQADIPVVDAQGQVTSHTYSDKQLRKWQQWNQAQQQEALDQRFGGIEQWQRQQQEQAHHQQLMQQAHYAASTTLGALRQQPYFKEHEADIRQALADHEEWGDNVHAAYNHVLVTKIFPTLSQAEQQAAVDSINNKATGGTVTPRGNATGRPKFKSFKEAAAYYEAHPDEAASAAGPR